jgi:universal stress protein E
MTLNTRMLVLVDPSQKKQQALRRARFNAERRGEKPHLTVFMAVDREVHKQMKTPPVLSRNSKWVDDTLLPLKEVGLEYDLCISWDKKWADAVLAEIKRSKPDSVLIPVYEDEAGNRVLTDETWKLLRYSNVNISLIHPRKDNTEDRKIILAAIKTQDPAFDERTKKAIANAKALAKIYDSEIHYVNAYQDQAKFPDRTKIMKMTGVPNSNVHVVAGQISDVLPAVSRKVKADIVMIAPMRKEGVAAALRGSTISRIIRNIKGDVMAIV